MRIRVESGELIGVGKGGVILLLNGHSVYSRPMFTFKSYNCIPRHVSKIILAYISVFCVDLVCKR